MPVPKLAMTASEKSDRLREISRQLFTLERGEEALVTAAEEQLQMISRRSTADPKAILGLNVSYKSTAAAAA
jgi:hypothetical protein